MTQTNSSGLGCPIQRRSVHGLPQPAGTRWIRRLRGSQSAGSRQSVPAARESDVRSDSTPQRGHQFRAVVHRTIRADPGSPLCTKARRLTGRRSPSVVHRRRALRCRSGRLHGRRACRRSTSKENIVGATRDSGFRFSCSAWASSTAFRTARFWRVTPRRASIRAQLGIGVFRTRSGNDGTITRFGWKAQNKSLAIFAGEAYNVEMGVTNDVFPQATDETPACNVRQERAERHHADRSRRQSENQSFFNPLHILPDWLEFACSCDSSMRRSPWPFQPSAQRGEQLFGTDRRAPGRRLFRLSHAEHGHSGKE